MIYILTIFEAHILDGLPSGEMALRPIDVDSTEFSLRLIDRFVEIIRDFGACLNSPQEFLAELQGRVLG